MQPTETDSTERILRVLLNALAAFLIPLEITPVRLAQLARVSFVEACAKQARIKRSGRPHLARIAARTGLSRVEVKRIVAANFSVQADDQDSTTRAVRVLRGWRNTKSYKVGSRPRPLQISGRGFTFESLCKSFSGDIPHTVILEELKRQGKVAIRRDGHSVTVVRESKARKKYTHTRELQVLNFAASLLSEALRENGVVIQRKERIVASANASSEYVEAAIANRLSEFLDQLPEMFEQKRPTKSVVNVFTLVSRPPLKGKK